MAEDKFSELGPLLTEVGQDIVAVLDSDPDGAFLFADVGDGWAGGGIYVEEAEGIRWFEPSDELGILLMKIWRIDNAGKPEEEGWIYMEYDVKGDRFNVSFTYPDEVASGSDRDDWCEAALRKRFGDRPVIYPPEPDWVLRIKAEEAERQRRGE